MSSSPPFPAPPTFAAAGAEELEVLSLLLLVEVLSLLLLAEEALLLLLLDDGAEAVEDSDAVGNIKRFSGTRRINWSLMKYGRGVSLACAAI